MGEVLNKVLSSEISPQLFIIVCFLILFNTLLRLLKDERKAKKEVLEKIKSTQTEIILKLKQFDKLDPLIGMQIERLESKVDDIMHEVMSK